MFVRFRDPAFPRWWSSARLTSCRYLAALCFAALLGKACVAADPFVGPEPSDPYASVPPVLYRSVTDAYVSLRPAKPSGWLLDQNAGPGTAGGGSRR
jgi:hypothetical protein